MGNTQSSVLTPQGEKAIKGKVAIPLKVTSTTVYQQDRQMTKYSPRQVPEFGTRHERPGLQSIVALGKTGSTASVPELITYLQSKDGNVRRLAAGALGRIGDNRASPPLLETLAHEKKPQVRQYIVIALGRIGDDCARISLETIKNDYSEKEYTRLSAQSALKRLRSTTNPNIPGRVPTPPQPAILGRDLVATFLSSNHPRKLPGPWKSGWAIDFHSHFSGADWNRSKTGELAYRMKYQNDLTVLPELVDQALDLVSKHPELAQVDAVVPVPPSTPRTNDPVSCFAMAFAQRLNLNYRPVLVKSRTTDLQKGMHTLAQKKANVVNAFKCNASLRNMKVLVVDDLFDSGATLEEIYRLLNNASGNEVFVLTLTRTIHTDA